MRVPKASSSKNPLHISWELINGEYIPKIIRNRTDTRGNGFVLKEEGTYLRKADFESEIPPILTVTDINDVPSDAPIGTIIFVRT